MRCEDARLELAALITGREEPPSGVAQHVAGCPLCARERDALGETVALLGSISTPPAALRQETIAAATTDDVARRIRTAVPALPPDELRAKVLAAATAGAPVVPLRARRRKGAVWSAAAVTIAVVVSIGWWALRRDGGRDDAEVFASIPRGHDLVEVTLRGETEAQATLTHYRHDNYRLTLSTAGYDVTPAGYQYAVWLRGRAGEVPLGGFRLKREDAFTIPFAIAVDPARYPEIVVTLEPADGDPALTGAVVSSARLDTGSVHHGEYDE